MSLKRWHINHVFLCLVILLIHSCLTPNPSILIVTANSMEENPQIIDLDLRMSQQIEATQQIITVDFQSHPLQLAKSNYMIFARFTVKNTGDELKKVTITLSSGTYQWQEVFQRKENLVDYCYDFTELTELYVPLEGIDNINTLLTVRVFLTLEYYLQLSDISATFTLFNSTLRQVCSLPDSDLLIFPDVFYLTFPNHTRSFQSVRFILTSYYLTNINISERLLALITLITEVSFKVLEPNEVSKSDLFGSGNFTGIRILLDTNLTKIRVQLEAQRVNDGFSFPLALKLQTSEKQLDSPAGHSGNIPSFHIPSWLMMPLWLGFLFGVPIIYLFKQQPEDELYE